MVVLLAMSGSALALDDTFEHNPVYDAARRQMARRHDAERPLVALTRTTSPIMVKQVQRAMNSFLGGHPKPQTYQQMAMLRRVLSNPAFRAKAEPAARHLIEHTIRGYEDTRPNFRIQRFERRQAQMRQYDRTMYGY
jgi:hypothetical protein